MNEHKDLVFEEIFKEFYLQPKFSAEYLNSTEFVKSFFYIFKLINEKSLEFEGKFLKYRQHKDIKGESEIIKIYLGYDLGSIENEYLETITGLYTRLSFEKSFDLYTSLIKLVNSAEKSKKVIKLIKSLHNIEYETGETISLFCRFKDQVKKIEICKNLPLRYLKEKVSLLFNIQNNDIVFKINNTAIIGLEKLENCELEIVEKQKEYTENYGSEIFGQNINEKLLNLIEDEETLSSILPVLCKCYLHKKIFISESVETLKNNLKNENKYKKVYFVYETKWFCDNKPAETTELLTFLSNLESIPVRGYQMVISMISDAENFKFEYNTRNFEMI